MNALNVCEKLKGQKIQESLSVFVQLNTFNRTENVSYVKFLSSVETIRWVIASLTKQTHLYSST